MAVRVELVRAETQTRTLKSIKALRRALGWSLAPAKHAIERALSGEVVTLDIADDRADQLVAELVEYGWTVRARGEERPGRPQPQSWLDERRIATAEVLAHEPGTDMLVLLLGPTRVPLEDGDALAIEVHEDFVLTEPFASVTEVPEGWRVSMATHDAEGLSFLTEYFTVGDKAVIVRSAPRDGGQR